MTSILGLALELIFDIVLWFDVAIGFRRSPKPAFFFALLSFAFTCSPPFGVPLVGPSQYLSLLSGIFGILAGLAALLDGRSPPLLCVLAVGLNVGAITLPLRVLFGAA